MEAGTKMAMSLAGFCFALLIAVLISLLWLWIHLRRKNAGKNKDANKGIGLTPFEIGKKGFVSVIDFKVLEKASGNFEERNVLGEGGLGRVYKALLDDNLAVAVKKIDCSGFQADTEFENEVNILSRIQHPNIICELGCSSEGDAKLIVYEFMENGSLETQLHGPSRGSALNWHMRMKIALDVARGLEYLHEHCQPSVIHRDLKTSNILLDANFNAKLSDFGLAITNGTQNKNKIKLSGTLGYVAPEYLLDGKLTEKSDVYAFGIVVLELLLGRRPMEKLPTPQCQSIITWAMPQLTDRSKLPNIVDPVISNTMDFKHLYQVAAIPVLCVQGKASYRPLIKDVLHSLIPLVPMELGDGSKKIVIAIPKRPPHKRSLDKGKARHLRCNKFTRKINEQLFYAGTSSFGISPPPTSLPLPTFLTKTCPFKSTVDGSTQNSRTTNIEPIDRSTQNSRTQMYRHS